MHKYEYDQERNTHYFAARTAIYMYKSAYLDMYHNKMYSAITEGIPRAGISPYTESDKRFQNQTPFHVVGRSYRVICF